MNTIIAFWYRKIISFTYIIEKAAGGDEPLVLAANEAIRMAAYTVLGDIEDTQELDTADRSA